MTAPGQFGVNGVQAERHWPPLTLAEAKRVLAFFPNSAVPETVLWHGQRPFSATALTRLTDGTVLFLKRHDPRLRDQNALTEEHAFMAHLSRHDLPVTAALTTREQHCALTDHSWVYEVFPPLPGLDLYRDVQSWEPFLCSEHAHTAGGTLARLHLAATDYAAPARPDRLLLSNFNAITNPDLEIGLRDWAASQPGLNTALNAEAWQQILRVLEPFHAKLRPLLTEIIPCWGHGDWHPSNQFWTSATPDAEVCGIFDFGMSDFTCAAYDLAVAIERTAISWLSSHFAVSWNQLNALLTGYHSVRPLTPQERELVVAFLPLVHVEFALSEVAYYSTLVQDKASAHVAYADYLLGHAQWFAGHDGQHLLNWLRETLDAIAACP
ncbi:phosphotransferase [Gluconobacter cerinus]|uniref:phosphotransferase enzyme family protein n=1 Tax=Gluconobacter cerinus TaxID=38307 RepID=UPI0030B5EF0D